MKAALAVTIALLVFAGCSGDKKANLAQEMGAGQKIAEIDRYIQRGKYTEARNALAELKNTYGHTKTYLQERNRLLNIGLSAENPDTALTARRLIELENTVLAFKRERGKWPGSGQIRKPLDAWNNETYWIVGGKDKSYDLLLVSAGPDSTPGSGDELIVVWVDSGSPERKHTGDKSDGLAAAGKKQAQLRQKAIKPAIVMSLDDLKKLEAEAGTPPGKRVTLDRLNAAGETSWRSGQPREGETVLSLEEIKETL